jgi:putative glutamine amidotransferase
VSDASGSPVIGLTTYREEAAWGVWHQSADLLHSRYAQAVSEVGGVPVLLPINPAPGAAEAVVARLDGLVIAGGADVDPARYGADPHPRTAGWRLDRDAWEFALLDAADAAALPTLGICRGMQVMAVHAGGSLVQHVPDIVGHEEHSPGLDAYGASAVTTEAGSRLAALVGATVTAPCHHHQSVAVAPGFTVVATAADGTTEAMEAPGDRFCLAVQWHPETVADIGVLSGLVAAAGVYARLRR